MGVHFWEQIKIVSLASAQAAGLDLANCQSGGRNDQKEVETSLTPC